MSMQALSGISCNSSSAVSTHSASSSSTSFKEENLFDDRFHGLASNGLFSETAGSLAFGGETAGSLAYMEEGADSLASGGIFA